MRSCSSGALCEDKVSFDDDMPMIKELRELRHHSVELAKTDVNQVSDLRHL
ncbi:hypothetical protein HMPREF1544_01035 [Mucor circinelloides 1006PhL]|uniref:Uncharacterized protein n=1 Tax=Mucor circinelloides f. circinelloides (strain 1006PhL) TaxID=1220926 RepID=S2KIF2_MUCC1|nr:hypothetical protein HMPREF1544_01035 [Mucor circinelloides 1006PhL]